MPDNDMQGRVCSKCKQYKFLGEFYVNTSYCKECGKKYKKHDAISKSKRRAQGREYASRPEVKKRIKEYLERPDVIEHIRKRRKAYRERPENKKRRKEYHQREDIKACRRILSNNRNAHKRGLPNTLTPEQWQNTLNYFNGCCAVCERQLNDMFGEFHAAMDHWIPISWDSPDNPGTVARNIIPLCHGLNGCNNQKSASMPNEWLIQKFGKRKAKKIATKIQTYFDHVASMEV